MYSADLHCDLLSYLADNDTRTIFDPEVRCSLDQLKKGKVAFQVCAVFTRTEKGSFLKGKKQFELFFKLKEREDLHIDPHTKLEVAAAIENGSGLCEEEEDLELAFKRFEYYSQIAGPILYVSLTWNHENRFGGGNLTTAGLKRDGELFLEFLDGKKCAIDLSHTSDALAHDILNYIDKKNLKITPLASHSNFRAVCDQPRNLTDDIAKEIIRRKGIIGLNFYKVFVGPEGESDFLKHLEHARSLNALENYCFGADFFYDKDFVSLKSPSPPYHTNFDNASCYPYVLSVLSQVLGNQEIENIATTNIHNFRKRL